MDGVHKRRAADEQDAADRLALQESLRRLVDLLGQDASDAALMSPAKAVLSLLADLRLVTPEQLEARALSMRRGR